MRFCRHRARWRWHRAALLGLAGLAGVPAAAQTANPWMPPSAQPAPVYADDLPVAGTAWGAAPGGSVYAPSDLEAQLSGVVPPAPATAAPAAPQAPAPAAPAMPFVAPPLVVPGVVTPVVPGVAAYPGALPYGSGPASGVAPVIPGYGLATPGMTMPYGYTPGYGAGWPGYAPGWGTGGWPSTGWGGWPGMGFSPFGFW